MRERINAECIRAADELLPLVYEELRKLASQKMAREAPGHTLQATALVHEAWIRLGEAALRSRPDLRWIASDLHPLAWNILAADAGQLPVRSAAVQAVVGLDVLHHLPDPGAFFAEAARVLRPGGRFVVVEPWMTPYLRAVHALASWKLLQRCWPKIEAFQTMTIRESITYFAWLGMPATILNVLESGFRPERRRMAWGKLEYVGVR